jgi:mono/diheme cytochrome c family protein
MLHRNLMHGTALTPHLAMAILLAGRPHLAGAEEIGDVAAGHRLSEIWCSSCHLVGPEAPSGVSNGAPTFPGIAGTSSTTPLSLRAFLQTPHPRMPDLHLTRDEADDLIAYILSLRRK